MSPTPTQAPFATLASAPALAGRLGLILAGLCALIARRFLREPHLTALTIPLWTRLSRATRRFQRVMARFAANPQPKPRQPAPRQPQPEPRQPQPRQPEPRQPRPRQPEPHRSSPHGAPPARLPGGHAWLVRALGWEAAAYTSQLDHLLAEPGVADLLAASPAAARILRPIAHMLGCQPIPALTLPRKPAKPRPASPPKPTPPAIPKHRPHHPRHNPHPLSFRIPARAAPEPEPAYYSWLPWLPAKPT